MNEIDLLIKQPRSHVLRMRVFVRILTKEAILGRVVFGQLMRFFAPPAVFGLWLLRLNVADYRPDVKNKDGVGIALQK